MSASKSHSGTSRPREDILTLAEAAAYLRTSEAQLADLAADGGVPARRIGGEWRFLRKALDDWLRYSGRPFPDGWLFPAHWLMESPFTEELLLLLEDRLLRRLKQERKPSARPGSKQAVLEHFGLFEGDDDLRERLADARARRESGG
jgi:excisionase family DNA binding protein